MKHTFSATDADGDEVEVSVRVADPEAGDGVELFIRLPDYAGREGEFAPSFPIELDADDLVAAVKAAESDEL